MKTAAIFCILVSLVAATENQQQTWDPQKEYTYDVYIRTLTAMVDVKDQFIGNVNKAKLTMQVKSDNKVVAKISQAVKAIFHGMLDDGGSQYIPDDKMQFKEWEINNMNFVAEYNNGVFHNITVEEDEMNHKVNALKSIMSQLTVDTVGDGLTEEPGHQLPEGDDPHGMYRTNEKLVTGECEIQYVVSPVPVYTSTKPNPIWAPEYLLTATGDDGIFQVDKSHRLHKCKNAAVYQSGMSEGTNLNPKSNNVGDIVSQSLETRVVASGTPKKFRLHYVYSSHRVVASPSPDDERKGMVLSQIALSLNQTLPISRALPEPQKPFNAGDLRYRYDTASDKDNHIAGLYSDDYQRNRNDNDDSDDDDNDDDNNGKRRAFRRIRSAPLPYARQQENDNQEQYQQRSQRPNPFKQIRTRKNGYLQPKPDLKNPPLLPFHPLFIGLNGHGIAVSSKVNIESEAKRLCNEIAKSVENDNMVQEHALQKHNILSDVIATMKAKQINDIGNELYNNAGQQNWPASSLFSARQPQQQQQQGQQQPDKESKIKHMTWIAFRDAAALAGTGPSTQVGSQWAKEGKVQGEEAVQFMTTLIASVRIPTVEVSKVLYKMVKDAENNPDRDVYAAALMSFAEYLECAGVDHQCAKNNYPSKIFGQFYEENKNFIETDVIPYLANKLENAVKQRKSQQIQLTISALGTLGSPRIMKVFAKYLNGDSNVTEFQRLTIVVSMKRLAKNDKDLARRVLYKIYSNLAEKPCIRLVAAMLLFTTEPSTSMIQQIAQQTHEDPSDQVRSAVKSAIESCAENKIHKDQRLADKCRAAKKFLTSRQHSIHSARSYLRDHIVKSLNLAYSEQISYIGSEDESIPQAIFYAAQRHDGKMISRLFDISAMFSSANDILKYLKNRIADQYQNPGGNNNNNDQQQQQQGSEDYLRWTTDEIAKKLNVKADEAQDIEGNFAWRIFGANRFTSFDRETLDKIPSLYKMLDSALAHGVPISINKFYNDENVEVSFPLTGGKVFHYCSETPTFMKVEYTITKEISNKADTNSNNPNSRRPGQGQNGNGNGNGNKNTNNNNDDYSDENENDYDNQSQNSHQNADTINFPIKTKITLDLKVLFTKSKEAIIGFVVPSDGIMYVSGYSKTLQVRVPLKLKVTVDKRQHALDGELELVSYNPQRDSPLLHLSNTPFTASFEIAKLQPIADSPDYKPIESRRLKKKTDTFGHKTTGMAFLVEFEHRLGCNDMQDIIEFFNKNHYLTLLTLPWPTKSQDMYHLNIRYDSSKSTTRTVKFGGQLTLKFHFGNQMPQQPQPRLDGVNGANPTVQEPSDRKRVLELQDNAASGMGFALSHGLNVYIVFNGQKESTFVLTLTQAENLMRTKQRTLLYVDRPKKESQQQKICLDVAGHFPDGSDLNFQEALQQRQSSTIDVHMNFGKSCSAGSTEIRFKIVTNKSNDHINRIENSPNGKQCKKEMARGNKQHESCLNATYEANTHDSVKMVGEWNNPSQEAKDIAQKLDNLLNYVSFWRVEYNPEAKGQPNRIEISAQFGEQRNCLNATMQTPSGTRYFENTPVHDWVKPLVAFNQNMDLRERMERKFLRNGHVCVADQKQISTFDKRTYKYNKLDQAWHVLAHYTPVRSQDPVQPNSMRWASEQYSRITVLTGGSDNPQPQRGQNNNNDNGNKQLLVIFGQKNGKDHVINVRYEGSRIAVNANGQKHELNENEPVIVQDSNTDQRYQQHHVPAARIYALPGNEVRVVVRDDHMSVYFDGESIRIQADGRYRGELRGLCGDYNGEHIDDFTTPKNCIVRSGKHFAASWALTDSSCSADVRALKQEAAQAKCYPIKYDHGTPISDDDIQHQHRHYGNNNNDDNNDSSDSNESSNESDNSSNGSNESGSHTGRRYRPLHPRSNSNYNNNRNPGSEPENQPRYAENNNNKLCFAQSLVPTCPRGYHPVEEEPRSYNVYCLDKNDSLAQMYKKQIDTGVKPDLSTKPTTQKWTFSAATKCDRN